MSEFTYEIPDAKGFTSALLLKIKVDISSDLAELLKGSRCEISHNQQFSYKRGGRYNAFVTEINLRVPTNKYEASLEKITPDIKQKIIALANELIPKEAGLDVMEFRLTPSIDTPVVMEPQVSVILDADKMISTNDVFIVHGHDHEAMKSLENMLYEFGLNPIVLHKKAGGGKTLVEKLEEYSNVGYAFVILSPDDVGISIADVLKIPPKTTKEFLKLLKKRARQNVVLEFGYFIGKLGRSRVCCLYKGAVELPSDMQGICYVPFKASVEEARVQIMRELEKAGYKPKI